VCTGGCPTAADQFCNLVIDVGDEWTAGDVAESEEAWWLRKVCQRARCRLIAMLAAKFGVKVPCVDDVQAYDPQLLAVPTVETVEHDICQRGQHVYSRQGSVVVHNEAVDTTRVTNGVLCQMHPSEGYWLFRGASRGTGVYGAMFGCHQTCGAIPTRSPHVPHDTAKSVNAVLVKDGDCIVRQEAGGLQYHTCFDEAYMKNLERMQWNRDNGVVELIPIVVGM
jgi:hypothetical protein